MSDEDEADGLSLSLSLSLSDLRNESGGIARVRCQRWMPGWVSSASRVRVDAGQCKALSTSLTVTVTGGKSDSDSDKYNNSDEKGRDETQGKTKIADVGSGVTRRHRCGR